MEACIHLARETARDGEGATKLIIVEVDGARTTEDARKAARTIALFQLGEVGGVRVRPQLGPHIDGCGGSGAAADESKIDLFVNGVCIMQAGVPVPFHRDSVVALMRGAEVTFRVQMNIGDGEATAWGCDLTEEYVIINSAYTT